MDEETNPPSTNNSNKKNATKKLTCGSKKSLLRRMVWLFIILALTAVLLYFLSTSVISYYNYESVTTSSTTDLENETLPAITMCLATGLDFSLLQFYGYDLGKAILDEFNTGNMKLNGSTEIGKLVQNATWFDMLFGSIKTELHGCVHQGKECAKELTPSYHYINYFPCTTFHSKNYIDKYGPIKASRAGFKFGVWIKFWTDFYWNNPMFIEVHDPYKPPNMLSAIKFSTGYSLSLAVTKEETRLLGPPYSKCMTKEEAQKSQTEVSHHSPYNQNECIIEQAKQSVLETCNCIHGPKNEKESFCSVFDALNCVRNFQEKVNFNVSIGRNCLLECDKVTYSLSWSKYNYGGTGWTEIDLYFDTFESKLYTEIPLIKIEYLFANIGGLVGLFVGISILSIIESIEICFNIIFKKMKIIEQKG